MAVGRVGKNSVTQQRPIKFVKKQKYISEDDDDNGYVDVACPECEATIHTRFQKGRQWRRLRCQVCLQQVTLYLHQDESNQNQKEFSQPLIQIR
jgi:hypothetical protein